MPHWNRFAFEGLSVRDKEDLLQALVPKLPDGFSYKGLEAFERFGIATQTGVYLYEGSEFVFLPGNHVTLGWERWEEGMDEATEGEFRGALEAFGVEDGEAFLREMMSPVRAAVIPPMLVERRARQIGWTEVSPDGEEASDFEDLWEELQKFRLGHYSEYTLHDSYKFVRDGEDIRCYLFNSDLAYGEFAEKLEAEGFALPTEEQWEYMFGGGCRTLFPWGDSFDYSLKLKYFGEKEMEKAVEGRSFDLEQPNGYGICFAGDPYQYELTSADGDFRLKGGDGGSMLCGGTGMLMGYLPAAAPYYRDPFGAELEWADLLDAMNARRVVLLSDLVK